MWTRPRYPERKIQGSECDVFRVFHHWKQFILHYLRYHTAAKHKYTKGQFAQNLNATDSFQTNVDGDPGDI